MGYVPTAYAELDGEFEVELLGIRRAATRLDEPLFDPGGTRMRG